MTTKAEENHTNNNSHSEELRCGLCLKPYTDPRLLNCLHSFCMGCIKDHVEKNKWKKSLLCSLCQKEMLIAKEGLEMIPKDYYIKARQDVNKLLSTSQCDLCTGNELAKSRCLNCDINLCANCKVKHSSPESDQLHHFLEIVEQPKEQQMKSHPSAKLSFVNHCKKHTEEEINVYCTKCNVNICTKCKEEKHQAHAVQETTETAKSVRSSLTHFLGAIKEYLPEFEEYVRQIRRGQKEMEKDLVNAIKDIQARTRFLQNEIEKIGQQIIDELKEKHKAEAEDLNKEAKNVVNSYKSVATVAASAERILKLGTDIDVIESSKKIQKRFMHVEDELQSLSMEKVSTFGFVPGALKADSLQKMFGQTTKGEISLPTLPIAWGIRAAKEFEMGSVGAFRVKNTPDTVQAIAPISDSEAWVCCGWGSKDIYLYTIKGERKKKVTLDIQVDHMCVTPSGEILVSSYEDKYIRKINKDHVVCEFAIPHLYPGGMVMTKRKELYVCAVDSYTTRRASHSYRCLMKMSEHGMNIDEIDEDRDTVLFGAPYRIAEAPNRDLIVTDREEGKLRVTRIDQEGCLRFVYTGPQNVNIKQTFNPLGVCCDKADNLMIADWGNHCVHMVNNDGEFIGFILSQKDGLFKPNALALDKAGHLWVGDGNATVRVYKYGKRAF